MASSKYRELLAHMRKAERTFAVVKDRTLRGLAKLRCVEDLVRAAHNGWQADDIDKLITVVVGLHDVYGLLRDGYGAAASCCCPSKAPAATQPPTFPDLHDNRYAVLWRHLSHHPAEMERDTRIKLAVEAARVEFPDWLEEDAAELAATLSECVWPQK